MNRNVAVVDIGSTSVQITVAAVDQTSMKLLAKEKHLARLADHLDEHGRLPASVIDQLIETLRAFDHWKAVSSDTAYHRNCHGSSGEEP